MRDVLGVCVAVATLFMSLVVAYKVFVAEERLDKAHGKCIEYFSGHDAANVSATIQDGNIVCVLNEKVEVP